MKKNIKKELDKRLLTLNDCDVIDRMELLKEFQTVVFFLWDIRELTPDEYLYYLSIK